EKLIGELRDQERKIYSDLAVSPAERKLVENSRQLYLTGRLLDFALTKEEWEEYKGMERHSGLNPESSFRDFYEEAEARDQSMAANLLKVTPRGPVVLVTGGFHAGGIDKRLVEAGCTVAT